MSGSDLSLALLAKRRELQTAVDAITALVVALSAIASVANVDENSSLTTPPGQLFPKPHADPE